MGSRFSSTRLRPLSRAVLAVESVCGPPAAENIAAFFVRAAIHCTFRVLSNNVRTIGPQIIVAQTERSNRFQDTPPVSGGLLIRVNSPRVTR